MMKFTCPHCNEKTFTPLQKALAGSMKSVGKSCPNCGRKCCNGMESAYFDSIISVIMLIAIFVIYMKADASMKLQSSILISGIIIARFVLSFLFKMFFGKLVQPVRTMK